METKKFKIPTVRTLLMAAVFGGVFLIGSSMAWGVWGAQTEAFPLAVIF